MGKPTFEFEHLVVKAKVRELYTDVPFDYWTPIYFIGKGMTDYFIGKDMTDYTKMERNAFGEHLTKKYPQLFGPIGIGDGEIDPRYPYSMFGIECGPGWFNILNDLCEKIKDSGLKVIQVKEKYGTLRFYTNYYTEESHKAITEAENLSEITCEVCGAPGTIDNSYYWIETNCPECRQKRFELNSLTRIKVD